jgi:hypothetical protein
MQNAPVSERRGRTATHRDDECGFSTWWVFAPLDATLQFIVPPDMFVQIDANLGCDCMAYLLNWRKAVIFADFFKEKEGEGQER